jgi:hypothetical protein
MSEILVKLFRPLISTVVAELDISEDTCWPVLVVVYLTRYTTVPVPDVRFGLVQLTRNEVEVAADMVTAVGANNPVVTADPIVSAALVVLPTFDTTVKV